MKAYLFALFLIAVGVVALGWALSLIGLPAWLSLFLFSSLFWVSFFLSPPLLDFSLENFNSVRWSSNDPELQKLTEQIEQIYASENLPAPRVGIIREQTPALFSYGSTRSQMRLIVSTGIAQLLSPEERKTLILRECSHSKNYDFAIISLAQFIPLLLMQFSTLTSGGNHSDDDRMKNNFSTALWFLAILCQWVVAAISRQREFVADRYALSRGVSRRQLIGTLMQIGYGWRPQRSRNLLPYATLISNRGFGPPQDERKTLARAEEIPWDLLNWERLNPWAVFFEWFSPHPRLSSRLELIARSEVTNEPPINVPAPKGNCLSWKFYLEILSVGASLAICLGMALFVFYFIPGDWEYRLTSGLFALVFFVPVLGFFFYLMIHPGLPDPIPAISIHDLLIDPNVSYFSPKPVRISAKIVGREEAGSIFDPNVLVEDPTGRLPLRITQTELPNFLVGESLTEQIGRNVEFTGLYRRSPEANVDVITLEKEHLGPSAAAPFRFLLYALLIGVLYYFFVWNPNQNFQNSTKSTPSKEMVPQKSEDPLMDKINEMSAPTPNY